MAPKGEKKARKVKAVKDPNAPKRPVSAYFWFAKDERPKISVSTPGLKVTDVAREIGKRWQDCSQDRKKPYEALAAKDKERYLKEKEVYKPKVEAENKAPSKAPSKGSKVR